MTEEKVQLKTKESLDNIGKAIEEKKQLDMAKKKMNNRRKAFSEKIVSYMDSRRSGEFEFLAPQGCIILNSPPEEAEQLVELGLFQYLPVDPKLKIPNIETDGNIAIYSFKCKRKKDESGRLEVEKFALVYCTLEDYQFFQRERANYLNKLSIDRGRKEEDEAIERFASDSEK